MTAPLAPAGMRTYQLAGSEWLRAQNRAGLADAWGLGKTRQAIAAATVPALIVCPANVCYQWQDEIKALHLTDGYGDPCTVVVAQGTSVERQTRLGTPAEYTIINTEMLRWTSGCWDAVQRVAGRAQTLILDEAHHFRGRNSQQFKGAYALAYSVPRVYLLTATPVYNKPDDLYALLKILDPDRFTSYWKFIKEHCRQVDLGWGPRILGLKPKSPLRKIYQEYFMERSYRDVGMELPQLIETPMPLDAPADWRKDYDRIRKQYKMPTSETPMESIMEVMHALRRYTAGPKLRAVMDLIKDQQKPVLIYTWYKDTANSLGALLDCPVITGTEAPRKRVTVAAAASAAGSNLVCNVAAISEGINQLSEYRHVIYFELDHTPGMTAQALGRVHRRSERAHELGPLHVVYPMVRKSIDVTVYNSMHDKRMTAREIVQNALL